MENKSSKYFKYAIGEIILVVIGILIALQINNWNEDRKLFKQSKTYISDIKKDLTNDTIMFNTAIKRVESTILNNKSVLNIRDFSDIKRDSLLSMLLQFHSTRIYQINNATYLKLVSTGFLDSKLFNTLFSKINNYYTKEFITYSEYLEWDEEQSIDIFHSNFLGSNSNAIDLTLLYDAHIDKNSDNYSLINSIRDFIASKKFRNKLLANYTRKELVVNRIKIQKQLAQELIQVINQELNHD